jgi:hypothetical protein
MTVYFADFDLTTGSNNGSSWANAFQSMQAAHDGISGPGDVVLCKGTDSITSTVSITKAGNYSSGAIRFIGVGSSYTDSDPENGAAAGANNRAVIDGEGRAISLITPSNSAHLWILENFELKRAGSSGTTYHGFNYAANQCNRWIIINCLVHHCYGSGFNSDLLLNGWVWIGSAIYSCYRGMTNIRACRFIGCRIENNTQYGVYSYAMEDFIGCLIRNNGAYGVYNYDDKTFLFNVIDGNTGDGVRTSYMGFSPQMIIGCRITNNGGYGINNMLSTARAWVFGTYLDNNASGALGGYLIDKMTYLGQQTVVEDGSDTDQGYADRSGGDFNLRSDATLRRFAINIPAAI